MSVFRLMIMLAAGFLAVEVAISGNLGSILGAIIAPSSMSSLSVSGANTSANTNASLLSAVNSTANSIELTSMIIGVFGPYAESAIKIAQCESSLNPNAVNSQSVNGSYATGLFQILYPGTWNTTPYAAGNPKDAKTNILAAYYIFKRDNYSWREWSCAAIVGV